jgi:hypothetical protein
VSGSFGNYSLLQLHSKRWLRVAEASRRNAFACPVDPDQGASLPVTLNRRLVVDLGSQRGDGDVKNLGTVERILRALIGSALAIWGGVLLFSVDTSLIWRFVDVALIFVGLDFVVTAIRGYCPLYNRLGWSTASN